MKGTSEEGTGRGMDGGGKKRAEEELGEEGCEQGSNGGKLQGRYPEEGTGQYTVYSETIPQLGPCHCYFLITNEK